jgi:hypothetical protein
LRADETPAKPRKFLVDVEETMKLVLEREDTDGNDQVRLGFGGRPAWGLTGWVG